jgi:hypothetical protein
VGPLRHGLAFGLAVALLAGCGSPPPAEPPSARALEAGWSPVAVTTPGPGPLHLDDLVALWTGEYGFWSVDVGPWRRAGAVGGPVPDRGWGWAAARRVAAAAGQAWPPAGTPVYRAAVRLAGDPGWDVRPEDLTLWAAVRGGTVAASWLGFRARGVTAVGDATLGPALFLLPCWGPRLGSLPPGASAVLPRGLWVAAVAPVAGAPPGVRAVTFCAGNAALEALLLPTGRSWEAVWLGATGSVEGGLPAVSWGDATGARETDVVVRFAPAGPAEGLAIFRLVRGSRGWTAERLFAGDGNLVAEVRAPGGVPVVLLALSALDGRSTAYQTVIWQDGRFRLGPGLVGPPLAAGGGADRPVPAVGHLRLAAALRRLQAAGYAAALVPVLAPGVPGTVLGQDPAPGGRASAVRVFVVSAYGEIAGGPPPALASLEVQAGARLRRAGPATLAAWDREFAWLFAGRPAAMPIVRGPGDLNGSSSGDLLVGYLPRPWRVRLRGTGAPAAVVRVDELALSDGPLYDGWVLLGAAGQWVAAVRLPPREAARLDAALRAVV